MPAPGQLPQPHHQRPHQPLHRGKWLAFTLRAKPGFESRTGRHCLGGLAQRRLQPQQRRWTSWPLGLHVNGINSLCGLQSLHLHGSTKAMAAGVMDFTLDGGDATGVESAAGKALVPCCIGSLDSQTLDFVVTHGKTHFQNALWKGLGFLRQDGSEQQYLMCALKCRS